MVRQLSIHDQEKKDDPTSTEHSDKMSKALKKQGFPFVGTTIYYAFMQAVGKDKRPFNRLLLFKSSNLDAKY